MFTAPVFIDVFIAPIRDNPTVQAAITALLVLILLDWVFGLANALVQKEFSSAKMRAGIGHKCSELGFVFVGAVADGLFFAGLDVGFSGPILTLICAYLIVMEFGSLLETFAKLNPDLEKTKLFSVLSSVKLIDDPQKETTNIGKPLDEDSGDGDDRA